MLKDVIDECKRTAQQLTSMEIEQWIRHVKANPYRGGGQLTNISDKIVETLQEVLETRQIFSHCEECGKELVCLSPSRPGICEECYVLLWGKE